MELKGRRELFCRHYIAGDAAGKGKLNGAAAARNAGYAVSNARDQAHQLLCDQEVQDRIAELADARNEKLELDANTIIIELLRMLTIDPAKCVDENGNVKSLLDIDLDTRRAITSFEQEETGSAKTIVRTKVKFWSKEKAAELLGRHLTLFKDVLKVEGLDELAQKIHEARERDARNEQPESLV
jgi:phage terminase small subunit